MIIVRIFHGSFVKLKYRLTIDGLSGNDKEAAEYRELGGLFGGHVAIQVGERIYGFYYKDKKNIHIFPRKEADGGIYQNQSLEEWSEIVKFKRETKVYIPSSEIEDQYLLDYFHRNLLKPEHDYSFFGNRCASDCFKLLGQLNKIKAGSYFLSAFYPGQFRKTLMKEAIKRGYKIEQKEGSKVRVWEGRLTHLSVLQDNN